MKHVVDDVLHGGDVRSKSGNDGVSKVIHFDGNSNGSALKPRVGRVGTNRRYSRSWDEGHTVDDLGVEGIRESTLGREDTTLVVTVGGDLIEGCRVNALRIARSRDL